jgi:hypothetical protein
MRSDRIVGPRNVGGRNMTSYPGEGIQPGWTVWASDGEELGKVVALDPETIHVKRGGLRGGENAVPRTAVDEVETGRVDLSMTKQELSNLS